MSTERIGAEEAHWAHNPRVGGSKLPFAMATILFAVSGTSQHFIVSIALPLPIDVAVKTRNGETELFVSLWLLICEKCVASPIDDGLQ